MHPKFEQVVQAIRIVRDREFPAARIACLTNGAHLNRVPVIRGLNLCDEAIVKLDASNEKMFQKMNRPRPGLKLADVVRGIKKLEAPIVQSMFVTGSVDNSTEDEVRDWIGVLRGILAREVQIYTLDRVPADDTLVPVDRMRLMEISMLLNEQVGIPSLVVFPD
jgi:wyosine [tRNA(Phe)-imidazoG37] synthetase (radical SAM superfamily)